MTMNKNSSNELCTSSGGCGRFTLSTTTSIETESELNMFEDVNFNVSSSRASKYLDQLSSEERANLDEFVSWLVSECSFKLESARSYRSNFARAVVKTRNGESINSDERSAVRKHREFMNS